MFIVFDPVPERHPQARSLRPLNFSFGESTRIRGRVDEFDITCYAFCDGAQPFRFKSVPQASITTELCKIA